MTPALAQLLRANVIAPRLVVPAQAAEVVSSNIVGYEKVNVPAGMTIVGQQFVAVGGTTNTLDGITNAQGLSPWGEDSIRIWDGSSYSDYVYYAYDEDEGSDGLLDTGKDGWGDNDQKSVDVPLEPGTGFWMVTTGNAKVCVSGEVSSKHTVSVKAGLSLVCNPQPCAVHIQDIVATGLSPWGEDSLRLWDGTSYSDYVWYAYDDDEGSEGLLDTLKDGWGDNDQKSVDVTIPAGQGFWIVSGSNATLTFPNAVQ